MGGRMLRGGDEEVVVALPPRDRIHAPRSIRSTLVASSLRSIRERGRMDEYVSLLPEPWRELPTTAIAGTWLPMDAGLAHYGACDALGFSATEQNEIGREVGNRIHGTFLGTMIRGAKGVGVTPWIPLGQVQKLYARLFDGGACGVTKLGPKDARMELVCNRLVGVPYFHHALRGLWQVALEFFCTKAYIHVVEQGDTFYVARVAWA